MTKANQHADTTATTTLTLPWAELKALEAEASTIRAQLEAANAERDKPIDAILFCPECKTQHVDRAEPDKCEDCGHNEYCHLACTGDDFSYLCRGSMIGVCSCKKFNPWLNPPHKKHRCHNCNHVWKAANVPTNGVESLLDAYDSILSAAGEGEE